MKLAQGDRRHHLQRALDAAVGDRVAILERTPGREEFAGIAQEGPPGRREGQRMGRAPDQLDAQAVFQLLELPAGRGLGQTQVARGPADRTAIRDPGEGLQEGEAIQRAAHTQFV